MDNLPTLHIALDSIDEGLQLIIESVNDAPMFDFRDHEEHGEARYQIKEGCYYDYEIKYSDDRKTTTWKLADHNCVKSHRRHLNIGTIAPNIYVGTLKLEVVNTDDSSTFPIYLEVQSAKAEYRSDYRDMLEFITERCTDLLLQSDSPAFHNFETNFEEDSQSLYQKFSFIKSVIGSDEFNESVHRIITNPATQWKEQNELKDIRGIRRFTNKNVRQFISGSNRTSLPDSHYLRQYGLDSLPMKVESSRKTDCVDTAENRFIKHALQTFVKFCTDIAESPKAGVSLKKDAELLIKNLEGHLSHAVFKEISRPSTLKLNSPLLQRKEGYREVLRAWLMFDLAAKLIWSGGDDVYEAGKKDIAVLYEYWLFFKLLELIEENFQLSSKPVEELVEKTEGGLNIKLKQGTHIPLEGIYHHKGRSLNVRFSYNRSFGGKKDYPASGSYTTTLRPDYTITIWPAGISESQAEQEELIVHIHFDAKYKVANFADYLIDDDEEKLNDQKTDNRKGIYKNADLLKMHAYKDAIRRTGGAYVLYPGTEQMDRRGFHEIVPGLGAFPVKPSKTETGTAELKQFINEVIRHFINRASQRERIAYRTYDIFKQKPIIDDEITESLPEPYGVNRSLIPDETFVLVGFYNSDEQYKWIQKGQYNFRMGSGNGSLILNKETVIAKYLLLHTHKDESSGDLWRITSKGPKVFTRANLEKKGYPVAQSSKDYEKSYLVIDIKKVTDKEFEGVSWDFKKLKNYSSGNASAIPFTASLSELMQSKVKL